MALRAVAGGTGRVRDGVRTQGGAATPAPPAGPNQFTFVDVSGAALSSVYTSNAVTVSGLASPGSVSIVGGTYSINGGAYTSAPGTVNNGDSITVQNTSSASNATSVDATLTVNAVSDTFTITTVSAGATGGTMDFSDPNNGALLAALAA